MSFSLATKAHRSGPAGPGNHRWIGVCAVLMLAGAADIAAPAAFAQKRVAPDTYTAVTTHMTPSGVTLKADILEWSGEDARAAVIEALQGEDPSASLTDLPTVGVVWRDGSAVGTAIKYAYRAAEPNGGERVVLVTDKLLGATSFRSWTVDTGGAAAADGAAAESLDYSVLELNRPRDGEGAGTISLAAEVVIDAGAGLVSLRPEPGAPMLLTAVALAPKPYWARDGAQSSGTESRK
jgi:hypothetical protein